MKTSTDYRSRFRILKGGKIALVISAMIGATTVSFAAPSGESIVSGSIVINRDISNITNINQSTNKGIINWQNFDVSKNETVNFNMPNSSSSTLNRVLSNNPSNIFGKINSNGQVFLINQNGVYFGKNSQVNTAGFTASTLDIKNNNFLNKKYTFEGTSNASILNLGTITTNNAYTALLAKKVINEGLIQAKLGNVQLASGQMISFNINGNSLVKLTIDKGTVNSLVQNKGLIQANGGVVYLTTKALDTVLNGVVNNSGIIEANSIEQKDGKIILFAHGGTANISGILKVKDGFLETSGKELHVEASTIVKANTWLLDPTNLVVESTGGTDLTGGSVSATAIQTALVGTDVELQAVQDITVNENITWANQTKLTLSAGDEVYVNAVIENTNSANGGVYFNALNTTDKVIFGIDGKVIVNNVHQLQWVNTALNGKYELGSNVDASATSTWNGGAGFNPLGNASTKFTGNFDGKNHTISNLYIDRPSANYIGLFGRINTGTTISNLGLVDVNIIGHDIVGGLVGINNSGTISNSYSTGDVSGSNTVGGLAGENYSGTISNSYATGSVRGNNYVGGLVGNSSQGTISNSYATGSVRGHDDVGGLVGYTNQGTISNSYATGSVRGNYYVGGLVGYTNQGTISNSYSTGTVNGYYTVGGLVGNSSQGTISNSYSTGSVDGISIRVGGLVGWNQGTISNSFWDTQTSGQATSGGGTGLTTAQMKNGNTYTGWDTNIWALAGAHTEGYGIGLPYLKNVTRVSDRQMETLFENGFGNSANPYGITNWEQLDNIRDVLTNNFYFNLSNNLDSSTVDYNTYASNTANTNLGWNPLGNGATQFIGNFDGKNHTISNLFINNGFTDYTGLFGYIYTGATISNLGLVDVDIGGINYVGGLVGRSDSGTISNSYTTGTVEGYNYVGGLVGNKYFGTISNSYATGSVRGNVDVGGLVGFDDYGTISNSYSTGNVRGYGNVGGLVGRHTDGIIRNSYSTGAVNGIAGAGNVGGLVGLKNSGYISNSFWDIQTSGQATSAGQAGDDGGTGKTTAQMKDGNTYTGWDTSIWSFGVKELGEGYEVGLPYLTNVTRVEDRQMETLFENGFGNSANPYGITNWEQLDNIRDVLTNNFYFNLSNNLDSSTAHYNTYASNTANTNLGWNPLGNVGARFQGSFDGKNHTISNLVIKRPATNDIGLFGRINTGTTISNLGLVDVNIRGYDYVGGLVGYNDRGTISNSYTAGYVYGTDDYVGGLVGFNNFGTISNSYTTGTVGGFDYVVGGLVGFNEQGTISNSYATGTVFGSKGVGGLVGKTFYGTILNSYATGYVNGMIHVGGLVGRNDRGTISNSYATGIVEGNDYVGGLVGYNNEGPISNSYSTGFIIGDNYIGGLVGFYDDGGLIGFNGISNSFWDTQTSGQATSDGGTGKTTAQMKNTKTFYDAGWDLDTIWGRDTNNVENDGYLDLRAINSDFAFNTVLALTVDNQSKVYDGTANVTTTLSKANVIDSVAFTANKNVGTYAFTSNLADYGLTYATGFNSSNTETLLYNSGNAGITPKALGFSANNKTYDGTTTALTNISGIIAGDTVSSTSTASFDNKNVGVDKTVTLDSVILDGADKDNYTIIAGQTTTADISKKALTLSSILADNKIYDGTTDATTTATFTGLIAGDSVSISSTFNNKNTGIAKTVTLNSLVGADGANYYTALGQTTTADISKKALTLSSILADNKIYDGTTDATTTATFTGLIAGDSVSISSTFDNKNAGTAKTVTLNFLSGTDKANYSIATGQTTTADVTQKALTLSNITTNDKVYDGTTTATTSGTLAGIITGDTVTNSITSTFDNKNAGTGKTVTLDSITLSGADKANYSVATGQTTTADVTQKALILSGITTNDKVYDGTTTATTSGTLTGIISGDIVTNSIASTFDNKNVGVGKTVTLDSVTLTGTDKANYSIATGQTTTADITTPYYQAIVNSILRDANNKYMFTESNNPMGAFENKKQLRFAKIFQNLLNTKEVK